MIFFTCSKHIELGAQGLAFEDGRRRHGGLSHLLLLSCSLDQGLRTYHLVTKEWGGEGPLLDSTLTIFWVQCFFFILTFSWGFLLSAVYY